MLFMFALGLALGLVLVGAWLFVSKREHPAFAGGLVLLGLLLGLLSGIAALDSGPANIVEFQMKPFLSELSEAGSLALAGLAGALVAAGLMFSGKRFAGRLALSAAAAAVTVAVVVSLGALHAYDTRADGPHPEGTDTSHTVSATRVIEGLEIPTGLAVAANGDIAIVELQSATFRLFAPNPEGFEQRIETRLPTPEGRVGLHADFHPDYPAQPYIFVTAETEDGGERYLNVFRGHIQAESAQFTAVVTKLPMAHLEDNGDHFGSAIAFCRRDLFVTVGDTEPAVAQKLRFGTEGVRRDKAQQLDTAIGKILRYRLNGIELEPAGLADSDVPIYALGFRNPFGLACDERTGYPVVAENGPDGYDQLRLAPPGSNHGWPLSVERETFGEALVNSRDAHLAPTGAAYRTANGGHELLMSAFFSQAIYVLPIDGAGKKGKLRLLREVEGGAFNVATDTAGCVYFTDAVSLWRLDDGRCD